MGCSFHILDMLAAGVHMLPYHTCFGRIRQLSLPLVHLYETRRQHIVLAPGLVRIAGPDECCLLGHGCSS